MGGLSVLLLPLGSVVIGKELVLKQNAGATILYVLSVFSVLCIFCSLRKWETLGRRNTFNVIDFMFQYAKYCGVLFFLLTSNEVLLRGDFANNIRFNCSATCIFIRITNPLTNLLFVF